MKNVIAIISGILFGLGLAMSEMINPTVVIAFLDVAGDWNPALMFVMFGALLVTTVGFTLSLKKQSPLCASQFYLPTNSAIDKPLIIGASLFGIGWGMAGYCPGPAIAGLAYGQQETIYFVIAMLVGLKSAQLFSAKG
ncbi:YeeE/YedE family protein [Thalassotalea hakodatensis]|uniref:YeeE/YedE family protein n=1 Tax=Thalassotalea hakodatensis TaxID=3030492 RepID=UPI00257329A5|nr:YeeE/YedE family protein [Thalassotalea hakodatensis]